MNRVLRNDWSTVPVPDLAGWRPTVPVSVVIPAYQCQETVDLALASLSRQTYPPHLLEVVDGSIEFVDTRNNKRQGKMHLKPAGVVMAGVPYGRPYQAPFAVR